MTPQEIIDHFQHERTRFRRMRADQDIVPADSSVRWDSLSNHIHDYLDQVDPKRQWITDPQLYEAMLDS